MHLGFVHAAHGPLAGVVEAAFQALPAGQLERRVFSAKIFFGP